MRVLAGWSVLAGWIVSVQGYGQNCNVYAYAIKKRNSSSSVEKFRNIMAEEWFLASWDRVLSLSSRRSPAAGDKKKIKLFSL